MTVVESLPLLEVATLLAGPLAGAMPSGSGVEVIEGEHARGIPGTYSPRQHKRFGSWRPANQTREQSRRGLSRFTGSAGDFRRWESTPTWRTRTSGRPP